MRQVLQNKRLWLALVVGALAFGAALAGGSARPTGLAGKPNAAVPEPEGAGGEGAAIRNRESWFYGQRAYPKAFTPPHALQHELAQARAVRTASASEAGAADTPLTWTGIGPRPIGSSTNSETFYNGQFPITGRVTAIATHPTDHRTAYAGGAYGGVWKTTDDGANWSPVSDGLPSLAVGALAIDPADANTLYLGTGEGSSSADSYYGAGLFKSTDAAAHWTKIGGTNFDGCHLGDIAVVGTVVLVAVTDWRGVFNPACMRRGMWRSTDGGSTWNQATTAYLAGEPTDESAEEIAVDPTHAGTVYAAYWGTGIFKSTDYGATWTQLANAPRHANGVGRTSIAVSNNGTHVYALAESAANGDVLGLYRSTDGGASWTAVGGTKSNLCSWGPGHGQCWYDNVIAVKPTDPTTFFAAGPTMNKFTSEGDVGAQVSFPDKIHTDYHALAYDAFNRLWIGTDGGVYRTQDDGATYANLNQTLALAQFEPGISGTLGGRLLGGTQDNGTLTYAPSGSWVLVKGGDGGSAAVDPTDPGNVFYPSNESGSFFRTTNGGATFSHISDNVPDGTDGVLFYPPFLISPSDHNTLYLGEQRVWWTGDRGDNWIAISPPFPDVGSYHQLASTIGLAPSDPSALYVGTNTGGLWVKQNAGTIWVNTLGNGLPGRYVTDIEVKPDDPSTAYATVSGFGSATPSNTGHVFKTSDFGAHWTNVSGGLPDGPVNAILADYRTTPATLYVGTDVGVFWSLDDGASWGNTSTGLPATAVVDLRLDAATNKLIAATHGRGMFTTPALTTRRTITIAKSGSGRITSAPAGIDCGSTCAHAFFEGAQVVLSASPDYGSSFDGWSGACANATGTCTVAMDADKSVTASFKKNKYGLAVAINGNGSGAVSSSPAGISCGATCAYQFEYGTVVTLTASAAVHSTFDHWSGACSGAGSCTITVDSAKSVTASFTKDKYGLAVAKNGSGSGTVSSSPAGISCGATCGYEFEYGTVVTLTPSPDANSTFDHWGGACSGTGPCTVTVDSAKNVTATFVKRWTLTVETAGDGSGTVIGPGINCGATCSNTYEDGTIVTVTAASNIDSSFTGWSGACTGTGVCTVTMDAAKSVVATFELPPFKPPACVVPKVVGKRLAAAKKAIQAKHCSVGRITKVRSKKIKPGVVVSESPKPGKRLKNGAKVSLRVSRGKK